MPKISEAAMSILKKFKEKYLGELQAGKSIKAILLKDKIPQKEWEKGLTELLELNFIKIPENNDFISITQEGVDYAEKTILVI